MGRSDRRRDRGPSHPRTVTARRERLVSASERSLSIVPQYNITSKDDLPAIWNDFRDEINQLEWGFIPGLADDSDDGPCPINARAETVAEKPILRSAFEQRRCFIPFDGF